MLHIFGLVVSLAISTVGDNTYKVYRIFPDNKHQIAILQQMENDYRNISFWKRPRSLSRKIDVMVNPERRRDFIEVINLNNMTYEIYINDVSVLLARSKRILPQNSPLSWRFYHNLDEIYTWMHSIARRYPLFVREIELGLSYEQRPIKGLKLSYGNQSKPGIFIEGGIHPREWISPATATFLLNQLLTSNERSIIKMTEKYDWYFFPIFNPDGYAFTHEKPTNIVNRLWRKTRSLNTLGTQYTSAIGTDLNHNWKCRWTNNGPYGFPFNDIYAGWEAFSEFEAKLLSSYIRNVSKKLFAYISLRGYGQALFFPSEPTLGTTFHYKRQLKIAKKATKVLKQTHGIEYTYGSLHKMSDCGTGTSLQWVKQEFGLPLAFTYEMRDAGNGFFLPPDQIIPNGLEVTRSIIALLKKAERYGDFQKMVSIE